MTSFWILLAALVVIAGLARRVHLRHLRGRATPTVDDESIRRILEEGRLSSGADEPLDLEEVARAEEEFWSEDWDHPDEYRP